METVERQRQLVNRSIETLFNEWEQQLRDQIDQCNLLRAEVKTLQNTSHVKDGIITQLQSENAQLKGENERLQLTSAFDDSSRLKALIEKHNNLYKEHELQKATATANQRDLIKQLRKERSKLKSWNHFSSPGPLPAHSPVPAALYATQNQLEPTDKSDARSNFLGAVDHAAGRSHAQADVSHLQNRFVLAGSDHLSKDTKDKESFGNLLRSTDVLLKDAGASDRPRLIEQPPKAMGDERSFVDAHLLHESRILSPELPSMPEEHQPPSMTGKTLSAGTEKPLSQEQLPQIGNSDSTAPPSEDPSTFAIEAALVDNAPSSDTPEFLGARSIKKNASSEVLNIGSAPAGNPSEPVTIKSDPDTSFVDFKIPQLARLASSMHESLDPMTARSEQRSPQRHRHPPLLPSPSTEKSPTQAFTVLQSLHSQRAKSEPTSQNLPRSLTGQPSETQRPVRSHAERAAPLRQIDGNARNGPRSAVRSSDLKSKKRKYGDSRGVEAILTISEDGEEFTTKVRKTSKEDTSSPFITDSAVHQRLGNLLTGPPARKEFLPLISRKTIEEMERCLSLASLCLNQSRKKPFKALLQSEEKDWNWWDEGKELLTSHNSMAPKLPLGHPGKQQDWTDQKIQKANTFKSTTTPSRPPGITSNLAQKPTPPSSRSAAEPPSHTPYRSLPFSSLNLTHFKLNPSANHNLTYAYTDVVRDQSKRKCLPGCARPECCGRKFAALAQTLPQPNNHQTWNNTTTTAPETSTPTSLSSTDHSLLKSHLGTPFYTTLLHSSSNPTAALTPHLLAARTAHLANKYGKAHRALHQRAQSPPGFWNVDFPGTQEREEEKRVAEEREREEVRRRWREALRNEEKGLRGGSGFGGGREGGAGTELGEAGLWMFADE